MFIYEYLFAAVKKKGISFICTRTKDTYMITISLDKIDDEVEYEALEIEVKQHMVEHQSRKTCITYLDLN